MSELDRIQQDMERVRDDHWMFLETKVRQVAQGKVSATNTDLFLQIARDLHHSAFAAGVVYGLDFMRRLRGE